MTGVIESEKRIVLVNASALRTGGALTILHQFISEIPDDDLEYLVFVDESISILPPRESISLVHVNTRSFFRRFLWDAFGLNQWVRRNHIHSSLSISLQNTGFRLNQNCPNFIYYHQPIPLYPQRWSLFKPEERSLWFYKYIYPYIVRLFINTRTVIFVQLEFIRDRFVKRYSFEKDKIHVVFPNLEIPLPVKIEGIRIDPAAIKLFYPATGVFYKNHRLLLAALSLIDADLSQKLILYLTLDKEDMEVPYDFKNIKIVFLGKITHEQVIWMYQQVDVLVFPSYIETLGLPLIEAASEGLPVIASDLDYSREVLRGYEGVAFVPFDDVKQWAISFKNIGSARNRRFEPYVKKDTKSWNDFFDIIKKHL